MGICLRHLFKIELDDGEPPVEGRLLMVDVTDVAREVAERHGLGAAGTQILSELIVCASLLIPFIKGDEGQTLQLAVDGAMRRGVVDLSGEGALRAYLGKGEVLGGIGSLGAQISALLGRRGEMHVLRFRAGEVLYQGASSYLPAGILPTFADYLRQSEQLSSSVHLSVVAEAGEGGVTLRRARGAILQALGGADPQRFQAAMARVDHKALVEALGGDEMGPVAGFMGAAAVELMLEQPLFFHCPCSRERMEAALMTLGATEVEAVMVEQGEARVSCHFCAEEHVFDTKALLALLARLNDAGDFADPGEGAPSDDEELPN